MTISDPEALGVASKLAVKLVFCVGNEKFRPSNIRSSGVDLRAALGQAGEGEIGGIAGTIDDGRGVEIDGGGGQARGVLPGGHGVAEGQRIGAGAAGIAGGAAIVQRQRRREPATVTASLRLSVSVTVLPALRSPVAGYSMID